MAVYNSKTATTAASKLPVFPGSSSIRFSEMVSDGHLWHCLAATCLLDWPKKSDCPLFGGQLFYYFSFTFIQFRCLLSYYLWVDCQLPIVLQCVKEGLFLFLFFFSHNRPFASHNRRKHTAISLNLIHITEFTSYTCGVKKNCWVLGFSLFTCLDFNNAHN